MPNQRAIAKDLKISQATVSLALRKDSKVSKKTIEAVEEAAKRLGYIPNSYVSALMSHTKKGRPITDKGCIAILVDFASEADWLIHHTYKRQYSGMLKRAKALGFSTEVFFIRGHGMTVKRLDGILKARGIKSLVLAAPHFEATLDDLDWQYYAIVTGGFSWQHPLVDRVASSYVEHVSMAYNKLKLAGYKRIGMCLQETPFKDTATDMLAGFYMNYHYLPTKARIPLLVRKTVGSPHLRLKAWCEKWKPDAIICEHTYEYEYLRDLGYKIPGEIAYVCLNRPPESPFSGIEENNEMIGRTMIDQVVAQTFRNEYGIPELCKTTLIKGDWKIRTTSEERR